MRGAARVLGIALLVGAGAGHARAESPAGSPRQAEATQAATPPGAGAGVPSVPSWSTVSRECASEPLNERGNIYYFCDCQSGAAPGCKPGDDAGLGRSRLSPWKTAKKAQWAFSSMSAGDTIAFCRGGVFQGNTDEWFNRSCRAKNPCRVRDYTPPWSTGHESDPKLINAHMSITNGGGAERKEGMKISNLEFDGDRTGYGIILNNDAKDIVMCNVTVKDYGMGIYVAGANLPVPGSDGLDARIVLRGSRILNNKEMGWLGSCDECRIEYNVFDHNGGDNMLDHSIYLNGANVRKDPQYVVHDMQVVGNELYHSAQGDGPICKGDPIVVHGNQDGLVIRGNKISQDIGTADGGCWGIGISAADPQGFKNVVVASNVIENVGNASLQMSTCQHCTIENNLIVQAQPAFGGRGILVHVNGAPDVTRAVGTAVTVRNNTIFFTTSQDSEGIVVGSQGRDYVVAGNVIDQSGSGRLSCLAYDLPHESYYSDYNLCWDQKSGAGSWSAGKVLSAWRRATSLDAHSSYQDPKFVRAGSKEYDFSPAARSPLIRAGDPAHAPQDDLRGRRRGAPPDVGALEHP